MRTFGQTRARIIAGSGATEPGGPGSRGAMGAPQQPALSAFSLSTDPILQAIMAQNEQMIANAETSALAQKKQLLLQYGDPELVKEVLKDDNYAQAAGQNPFSTLANLRQSYEQGQYATNEGMNKANLFYSSTRGQALGNLARAYQGEQASAAQSLQGQLGGIEQALLGTKQQAASNYQGGLQQAYENALQFALQYGATPSGVKAPIKKPSTTIFR